MYFHFILFHFLFYFVFFLIVYNSWINFVHFDLLDLELVTIWIAREYAFPFSRHVVVRAWELRP